MDNETIRKRLEALIPGREPTLQCPLCEGTFQTDDQKTQRCPNCREKNPGGVVPLLQHVEIPKGVTITQVVVGIKSLLQELEAEDAEAVQAALARKITQAFKVPLEYHKGLWVVKVYDGFDHCWTDCCKPVSADDALELWLKSTKQGTKNTCFKDIDYYAIYPENTQMLNRSGS